MRSSTGSPTTTTGWSPCRSSPRSRPARFGPSFLKLWFVIRHYGIEGLRHHLREHVAMAQAFAGWVKSDPRFELVVPPPLNLVCFRFRGTDDANQRILEALNRSGQIYLTHTKLSGRFTLRLCVGQTMTQRRHVERAWALIQEAASKVPAT